MEEKIESVRLQKYVSDCGLMSRRAAEKEIEAGYFTVNGEVASTGMKIVPGEDVVAYKGKILENGAKKLYVMLYKPRGYVTTMSDEEGRKCIPDLLSDIPQRVYPCGRLDMDSEGLLILTNDGEVANKLMHPKNHVEKVYHVKVDTEIQPEKLSLLNSPMLIDGYRIKPVKVTIIERKEGATILKFALSEGRNRQIRKMCEQAELKIIRLKRVSVGNLNIGMLSPGKWKYLNHNEITYLKNL
ncbi:MAG: rRNA pseudouridine synthase [Clostridiales bacterium]|nr:rRNA pseudouridine synthase [Clostridiales bacterium]